MSEAHSNILVVLHRPRDVVNIGGVVRAMLNMGFRRLRLVEPAPFEAAEIERLAHRSASLIDLGQRFATLDEALADAVYVVGTTARPRGSHPARSDVRVLAPELLGWAARGPVALLFGPEDTGLDNTALDRCHTVVSLPVDRAYSSLNLAQAALLLLYELRMAETPPAQAVSGEPPATQAQLERLAVAAEGALRTIDFFKSGAEPKLRALRQVTRRADLSGREAELLAAIAYAVARLAPPDGDE